MFTFILITTTCLCVSTALASTSITQDLDLVSTSDSIHDGLAKNFDVNCSFSHHPASGLLMVTSLVLSKADVRDNTSYQVLASLTLADPDNVVVANSLGAAVTGSLKSGGNSLLSFHWLYPPQAVEGSYRCMVHGISSIGQPISATADISISERALDLTSVLGKVKVLEVNQDDVINRLTAIEGELQSQIDKRDQERAEFGVGFATFRNHDYLLSRPSAWNVPDADVMCRTLGGYLVEINDDQELEFVAKMLDDNNWTGHTLYGATDLGHENYWSYLHSGQSAFLKWQSGQPRNSGGYNCLYSHKNQDWLMLDYVCVHTPVVSYICEFENLSD